MPTVSAGWLNSFRYWLFVAPFFQIKSTRREKEKLDARVGVDRILASAFRALNGWTSYLVVLVA
jgi:hypothetical protein